MNIGGTNLLSDLASGSGGVSDHTQLTNIGTNSHATIDSFIASKGQNNGLCDLTAQGKVPTSRLPISSQSFLGLWNATTNTPTIVSGTGNLGDYYVVNVAGTTTIDGISTWQVDDKIIYTGSKWERIDEPDPIIYEEVLNTNYKTNKNIPLKNDITVAQLTNNKYLITKEYHDTLASTQDNKITNLELKTQNIDLAQTNASRTYFNNNIETIGNLTCSFGNLTNGSCTGSFSVGFLAPSPATNIADIGSSALRFKDIFIGSNIDHSIFKVNTLGNVIMNDVTSSNTINGNFLILNNQAQSNKYYNKNGTAGLDISNTNTGGVNLTGNKYQGHNNSIVTLNGSGQIQQPSDNAKVDGNGNIECKNATLTHDLEVGTTNGFIKASKLQSRLNTDTLILNNLAPNTGGNGRGITIDATVNGNVQLTGDSYVGTANAMVRLNTNGTIEKTPCTIDGASNNNISNVNTLTCSAVVSSNILNSSQLLTPNFVLGTFGGGTASAGLMNLNSGRIDNITRLEWFDSNVSIGNSAMYQQGTENVCIGSSAGSNLGGTSTGCVHIGRSSRAATGNYNISIGDAAGPVGSWTGSNNICVGETSGTGLTTANNCIFIGKNTSLSATSNNQIVIGDGISRRPNEFVCGSSTTAIVRPDTDNVTDLGVRDVTGNHQWKDIYFSGNLYQNGTLFTGGGGSINGISSVDNGSNDIEISFTGTDYLNKQGQFLYFDNNTGRIQATTTYTPANTEYNNISSSFNTQYTSSPGYQTGDTWSILQIYLKSNLAPGSWINEPVNVVINKIRSATTTRVIVDTVVNNWTGTNFTETLVSSGNITNANLIYSTQQPSKTTVQDISTRFKDNYEGDNLGETVTQITEIWVTADPNVTAWTPKDVFYIRFFWNTTNEREAEVSLWGSTSGWVYNTGTPGAFIPRGTAFRIL